MPPGRTVISLRAQAQETSVFRITALCRLLYIYHLFDPRDNWDGSTSSDWGSVVTRDAQLPLNRSWQHVVSVRWISVLFF